jgi:hypothetical protein
MKTLTFLTAFFVCACTPQQAKTVVDAGVDVAKAVVCVDTDLAKGMSPEATAIDCGLKSAADVENLVGAAERLAAHRAARGRDAGAP